MKSNKVLYISELWFNLPDWFTGTKLDALKLLVQYRETKESENAINSDKTEEISNIDFLWQTDNIKCVMDSAIGELIDGEWKYR
jgi:hypothetical protein